MCQAETVSEPKMLELGSIETSVSLQGFWPIKSIHWTCALCSSIPIMDLNYLDKLNTGTCILQRKEFLGRHKMGPNFEEEKSKI